MSTPVGGVTQEPLFGGTRGTKRPAAGKPTNVPRNLPAFRGVENTPGSRVKAPRIETKNRNNRGTNVTIPYGRLVPWDMLKDVGRISPGDAVFVTRMRAGGPNYAPTAAPTRVVGVDWMNRQLGNGKGHGDLKPELFVPGFNVLLGARFAASFDDPVADFACDNWRELSLLRGWALDGVVLSNDEPGVYSGSGSHDSQLFNIAIAGLAAVNNGYEDYRGRGITADARAMNAGTVGAHDGVGSYGLGDKVQGQYDYGSATNPYYHHYPLQMFDRKVKALSELFVGLVATRQVLTPELRRMMFAQPNIDDRDKAKLYSDWDGAATTPNSDVKTFYTYRYVYFSSRSLWQLAAHVSGAGSQNDPSAAEPPTRKALGHPMDGGTDPYEPVSVADVEGMVGAWKVGKVFDIAARKHNSITGGPMDTTDQLTVNVNIEWLDWRALRRVGGISSVGSAVAGALDWRLTQYNTGTAAADQLALDDGRVMQWPTEYFPGTKMGQKSDSVYNFYPTPGMDSRSNIPLNMQSLWDREEVETGRANIRTADKAFGYTILGQTADRFAAEGIRGNGVGAPDVRDRAATATQDRLLLPETEIATQQSDYIKLGKRQRLVRAKAIQAGPDEIGFNRALNTTRLLLIEEREEDLGGPVSDADVDALIADLFGSDSQLTQNEMVARIRYDEVDNNPNKKDIYQRIVKETTKVDAFKAPIRTWLNAIATAGVVGIMNIIRRGGSLEFRNADAQIRRLWSEIEFLGRTRYFSENYITKEDFKFYMQPSVEGYVKMARVRGRLARDVTKPRDPYAAFQDNSAAGVQLGQELNIGATAPGASTVAAQVQAAAAAPAAAPASARRGSARPGGVAALPPASGTLGFNLAAVRRASPGASPSAATSPAPTAAASSSAPPAATTAAAAAPPAASNPPRLPGRTGVRRSASTATGAADVFSSIFAASGSSSTAAASTSAAAAASSTAAVGSPSLVAATASSPAVAAAAAEQASAAAAPAPAPSGGKAPGGRSVRRSR